MGAKALIIMNWGKAEDDLIQMGAIKAQWGNPTPDTEKEIVRLTVMSISRRDGEYLAGLCKLGEVKVWLKASASRQWITADQPMGRVCGGKSNGQYILVGSHVDAWGKSAICNASGNALNLELARICQKYKGGSCIEMWSLLSGMVTRLQRGAAPLGTATIPGKK